MKIPPVKGTRDFYPEQMRLHNWIVDGWKNISVKNGYAEYDGPIFEYLKMYQQKSGEEIAEQLFSFEDRGGRMLAIRPEITPTLARMVNQQINSLPRPIKWFSVPRVCRAERPQKGRLREFFQWNIDIIGVDEIIADAEIIFCAVDYLRSTGLNADDVVAKISSRKMLAAVLESIGVPEDKLTAVYAVLDKRAKLSDEAFKEMLTERIGDGEMLDNIVKIMSAQSLEQLAGVVKLDQQAQNAINELGELFDMLDAMGIGQYCTFDISIVRGLAYYTGVVFEVHDKQGELRAVCGGGRYDNLLKDFGGPAISATGMGMGDCVLEILLESKGLLKDALKAPQVDYYVAVLDDGLMKSAVEIVSKIRTAGKSAEFSYKAGKLGKLMKQASNLNAQNCIILGQEFVDSQEIAVKNMITSDQQSYKISDFISQFA